LRGRRFNRIIVTGSTDLPITTYLPITPFLSNYIIYRLLSYTFPPFLRNQHLSTMPATIQNTDPEKEGQLQVTIEVYKSKKPSSIRTAIVYHNVPYITLQNRLKGIAIPLPK